MALHESVAFVLAQMTLEGQRAAESDIQLKADLTKQRHENGRLTMQVPAVASLEQLPYCVTILSRRTLCGVGGGVKIELQSS